MGFEIKDGVLKKYKRETGVKDIIVPEGVTKVAHGAFENCPGIESVSLPDSLVEIGGKAFYGLRKLVKINIPKSVVRIGRDAFGNTKLIEKLRLNAAKENDMLHCGTIIIDSCLVELSFPNSIIRPKFTPKSVPIDKWEYVVPDNVTCIYDDAFNIYSRNNSEYLSSIILPKSLKCIAKTAFSGCKWLTNLVIPQGVKQIGSCAFSDCKKLESIELPQGLEVIGDHAFRDCTKLRSIDIPDTVVYIDDGAFMGCKMLNDVNASRNVPFVSYNSFDGTKWFENIKKKNDFVMLGNVLLCSSQKAAGDVVVPEGVTIIASHAFWDTEITSVIVSEGVEIINDKAFGYCEKLTELSLPSTLRKIGTSVFQRCDNVSKLVVADNPYLELKDGVLYKKDSRRVKILTLKK